MPNEEECVSENLFDALQRAKRAIDRLGARRERPLKGLDLDLIPEAARTVQHAVGEIDQQLDTIAWMAGSNAMRRLLAAIALDRGVEAVIPPQEDPPLGILDQPIVENLD